tara:strand:- start:248 stop:745 length:498 start_codon:yes stop_codon:yes gene_type:complete
MLDFKKIENIAAIVLLVAFFMPWLSVVGLGSMSGYDIPGVVKKGLQMIAGIEAAFSSFSLDGSAPAPAEPAAVDVPFQVYLVYLVPLAAIAVLVADYLKLDEKVARIISVVAGVIPVGGFVYGVIAIQDPEAKLAQASLEIGAYLMLLAGIAMLLATFKIIKMPK